LAADCKICNSRTNRIERHFRKRAESRFYRHCPECDFVSLEEQHIITSEEEFEVYERHENSINDPRYVEFFMKFIDDAIIDHIEPNEIECLDFGSGPEPVLAELLENKFGWQVDIYDKFYSREKVYKDNTYDLITSTEVAEHLDDPLHYFRLFKRLLRPDGLLSIMTLFHPGSNDFANWFYINDPTHISFFSEKTMEVISEIIGLDILYCDNHRYVTFSHACPP
jgi:SAM-dependent methyltransferase